jgi:hypothetical protein
MRERSRRYPQSRLAWLTFTILAGLVLSSPIPARAQFTTVINVPPDVAPNSIGSNTQLNLFDGGSIGSSFDAGASNGSGVNIEVNVFGGSVGTGFAAFGGSTVNISGGSVGTSFQALGTVNILNGVVGSGFRAWSGGLVNILGGSIGADFHANSGSVVNIWGGALGDDFDASSGSIVRIAGSDFRLNGVPIEGLGTIGSTVPLDIPAGAVLSGVLADGLAFVFTSQSSDIFAAGTLTLEAADDRQSGTSILFAIFPPRPLTCYDTRVH